MKTREMLTAILATSLLLVSVAYGYIPGTRQVQYLIIRDIESALEHFKADVGRYPSVAEGLAALQDCPIGLTTNRWKGPYWDKYEEDMNGWGLPYAPTNDAWQRPFVYVFPGVHNRARYDIYSVGPDGRTVSGGEDADDLNNWSKDQDFGCPISYTVFYEPCPYRWVYWVVIPLVGAGAMTGIIVWIRQKRSRKRSPNNTVDSYR